ncbi:MAG TPA: gamma-glutamylcyclotransferase [Candidatus Acidoferrum sp.]|nr:gamma-glutamylcyclotransferase [Candidatus Acidoferrum sp.]
MTHDNDNRMGWIRNLQALASGGQDYIIEYELGSECQIFGVLDYANGQMILAPMSTEESRDRLWLYNLTLHFASGPNFNPEADDTGYYFKDGILGELLALMSVRFQCRFYLISSRLLPPNPSLGMTIKKEYPFVRVRCNPGIHPPVFQRPKGSFTDDFKEFLDTVKKLDKSLHQDFILACHHYARAVKEVGVDPEMVFIRLVSAVEALSKNLTLNRKDDTLEEQQIADLIVQSHLSTDNKNELKNIFDVRKSRKKFVRFIEQHSSGFFTGGNVKAKHLKIRRGKLAKTLNAIYTARSKYLHAGEPMFLSQPFKGGEKWDTDPTSGMIVDNRSFPAGQKLPYAWFFEGLVRHCLLNYLKEQSMSQNVFAYGSNMCSGRFRAYRVHPDGAGRGALLRGYRLLFNKRSTDGSGKANVEAREAAEVWGVLYSIPDADLPTLDDGEVGYERVTLPVRTADNAESQAWVYIASPANTDDGLRPYTWYKRFLVEGAREHALPPEYIASLENIDAAQDTDAARDRRKRALACEAPS